MGTSDIIREKSESSEQSFNFNQILRFLKKAKSDTQRIRNRNASVLQSCRIEADDCGVSPLRYKSSDSFDDACDSTPNAERHGHSNVQKVLQESSRMRQEIQRTIRECKAKTRESVKNIPFLQNDAPRVNGTMTSVDSASWSRNNSKQPCINLATSLANNNGLNSKDHSIIESNIGNEENGISSHSSETTPGDKQQELRKDNMSCFQMMLKSPKPIPRKRRHKPPKNLQINSSDAEREQTNPNHSNVCEKEACPTLNELKILSCQDEEMNVSSSTMTLASPAEDGFQTASFDFDYISKPLNIAHVEMHSPDSSQSSSPFENPNRKMSMLCPSLPVSPMSLSIKPFEKGSNDLYNQECNDTNPTGHIKTTHKKFSQDDFDVTLITNEFAFLDNYEDKIYPYDKAELLIKELSYDSNYKLLHDTEEVLETLHEVRLSYKILPEFPVIMQEELAAARDSCDTLQSPSSNKDDPMTVPAVPPPPPPPPPPTMSSPRKPNLPIKPLPLGDSISKETIFATLEKYMPKHIDTSVIESEFSSVVNVTTLASPKKLETNRNLQDPGLVADLDHQWKKNAEIGMKKLNKKKSVILSAIQAFDAENIEAEDIEILLQIIPKEKNEKIIKNMDDQSNALNEPLKCMKNLSKIPRLKAKLTALATLKTVRNCITSLSEQIALVKGGCKEIRGSEDLKKIYGAILMVVNKVFCKDSMPVIAFDIASVGQLSSRKSANGDKTLLQSILNLVQHNLGPLDEFTLTNKFENLRKIGNIELGRLKTEILSTNESIQQMHKVITEEIQAIPKTEADESDTPAVLNTKKLANEISEDWNKLHIEWKNMEEQLQSLVSYFGYPSEISLEECGKLIHQLKLLVDIVEKAIDANKVKKREVEKAYLRGKSGGSELSAKQREIRRKSFHCLPNNTTSTEDLESLLSREPTGVGVRRRKPRPSENKTSRHSANLSDEIMGTK